MAKFEKGKSGNPGGMTPEVAHARRLLNQKLTSTESVERFWRAYQDAAENGNATILVDYANRLMGKVKEEVELSESEERPLRGVAVEKLLALADALK